MNTNTTTTDFNVETLAEISLGELNERADKIAEQVTERMNRARDADRDLTHTENELTIQDRSRLAALRDAISIREQRDRAEQETMFYRGQTERRARELSEAYGSARHRRSDVETRARLRAFEANLRTGVPQVAGFDVEYFERAADTSTVGASESVAATTGRPVFIWSVLRFGTERATTNKVSGPTWPALSHTIAPTDEGVDKPLLGDPTLDEQELPAYASRMFVSDQVVRFGIGDRPVHERLAAQAIFSTNSGIVGRINAYGTPLTAGASPQASLDSAIAEVAAFTGGATGIVLNQGDYSAVAERSATSAGDVESGTSPGTTGCRSSCPRP